MHVTLQAVLVGELVYMGRPPVFLAEKGEAKRTCLEKKEFLLVYLTYLL